MNWGLIGQHCTLLTQGSMVATPTLAVFIHLKEVFLVRDFFTEGVIYHTNSFSLTLAIHCTNHISFLKEFLYAIILLNDSLGDVEDLTIK